MKYEMVIKSSLALGKTRDSLASLQKKIKNSNFYVVKNSPELLLEQLLSQFNIEFSAKIIQPLHAFLQDQNYLVEIVKIKFQVKRLIEESYNNLDVLHKKLTVDNLSAHYEVINTQVEILYLRMGRVLQILDESLAALNSLTNFAAIEEESKNIEAKIEEIVEQTFQNLLILRAGPTDFPQFMLLPNDIITEITKLHSAHGLFRLAASSRKKHAANYQSLNHEFEKKFQRHWPELYPIKNKKLEAIDWASELSKAYRENYVGLNKKLALIVYYALEDNWPAMAKLLKQDIGLLIELFSIPKKEGRSALFRLNQAKNNNILGKLYALFCEKLTNQIYEVIEKTSGKFELSGSIEKLLFAACCNTFEEKLMIPLSEQQIAAITVYAGKHGSVDFLRKFFGKYSQYMKAPVAVSIFSCSELTYNVELLSFFLEVVASSKIKLNIFSFFDASIAFLDKAIVYNDDIVIELIFSLIEKVANESKVDYYDTVNFLRDIMHHFNLISGNPNEIFLKRIFERFADALIFDCLEVILTKNENVNIEVIIKTYYNKLLEPFPDTSGHSLLEQLLDWVSLKTLPKLLVALIANAATLDRSVNSGLPFQKLEAEIKNYAREASSPDFDWKKRDFLKLKQLWIDIGMDLDGKKILMACSGSPRKITYLAVMLGVDLQQDDFLERLVLKSLRTTPGNILALPKIFLDNVSAAISNSFIEKLIEQALTFVVMKNSKLELRMFELGYVERFIENSWFKNKFSQFSVEHTQQIKDFFINAVQSKNYSIDLLLLAQVFLYPKVLLETAKNAELIELMSSNASVALRVKVAVNFAKGLEASSSLGTFPRKPIDYIMKAETVAAGQPDSATFFEKLLSKLVGCCCNSHPELIKQVFTKIDFEKYANLKGPLFEKYENLTGPLKESLQTILQNKAIKMTELESVAAKEESTAKSSQHTP